MTASSFLTLKLPSTEKFDIARGIDTWQVNGFWGVFLLQQQKTMLSSQLPNSYDRGLGIMYEDNVQITTEKIVTFFLLALILMSQPFKA